MKIQVGFGKSSHTDSGARFVDLAAPEGADWSGCTSIIATDVLAHVHQETAAAYVREWADALPPGGELVVAAVDAHAVAESLIERRGDLDYNTTLLGKPGGYPVVSLWNMDGLAAILRANGFTTIQRIDNGHRYTMLVRAVKATDTLAGSRLTGVRGVMSCPRLGFTTNQNTMHRIAFECGVDFYMNDSVFWGQGLTAGIEEAIASNAKYILTMDYDTKAEPRHVFELVRLAEMTGSDAIAPGQMRRGKASLLAYMDPEDSPKFFRGEALVKAHTAHFGLTLLRASAFEKMPKPWFMPTPAPDGTWGDGKIDEDIEFWRNWEKVGNTLFVASQVCIGHIEAVVACVGYDGNKVYVPLHEMDVAHTKARY